MEAKYEMMTEQLRMTNSDEEVGNYLRWIITSDTAREYWEKVLLNKAPDIKSVCDWCGGDFMAKDGNAVCDTCKDKIK